jgi:HSP20 family molecular chaperone IbpA
LSKDRIRKVAGGDCTDWMLVVTKNRNVPIKTEKTPASSQTQRFESVRREMDSLLEDFFRRRPSSTRRQSFLDMVSRRTRAVFGAIPIVLVIVTDRAYEITSELPGEMDKKMWR